MAHHQSSNPDRRKDVTRGVEAESEARGFKDAIEGWAFSTGTYNSALGAGASENILIDNPTGSGVVIFPYFSISSNGEVTFRRFDSVTIDTAGTSITPNNRRLSNGDSLATVEKNVAFSGGNGWTPKISGSGKSNPANTVAALTPDVVLEPGDNMVFQLTNTSSDTSKATLDIDYFEVPTEEIPEL